MKSRLLSASVALVLAALPTPGHSQGSTAPVGVIVYTLPGGATTPVGVPVFADAVFSGASTGVSANSLTVSGVTWTAGQYAQIGAPYFVLMLSGGQTGRLLQVTANTASSVTVATGTTSLSGDATTPAFAVAVGDRFEIFPGDTLSSLFGDGSVDNPVQLQKGTSTFTADSVQIFNGVKWISYYFHATNNVWTNAAGTPANQNNVVLPPDAGLLIGRRGATTTIAITGRAPTTSLVTRIPGGAMSSIALRFPADTTLGALNFSNPGTWVASDSALSADRVNLFNGIKWVAYYKTLTGGIWKQVGGDDTDQSGKVVAAGSCLLIQKQGAAADSAAFFSQVNPYSTN